jgi:hypothetical protein
VARRETRLGGLALVLGGLLWAAAWMLEAGGDDASRLGEDGARALLNPALLLIAAGLWAFVRRFGRGDGAVALAAAATEVGLALMLGGNLADVGLTGDGLADAGWAVLLAGGLVTLVGLVALGVTLVRLGAMPRQSGLLFALGLVGFVAGLAAAPLFGLGWFLWGFLLLGAGSESA